MSKEKNERRFEEKDRAVWTPEQREKYQKTRNALAPFIKDLTTPAPKDEPEKPKDWLEELFA